MGDPDPLDPVHLTRFRRALSSAPSSNLHSIRANEPERPFHETIIRLCKARLGPGRLTAGEYGKYSQIGQSSKDLLRFVGVQVQAKLHAACNDRDWFAVTKNKLLFEMTMLGARLPVARTSAVYDRKGRGAGVPILKDPESLKRFLFEEAAFPLFCKPTTGVYSLGTLHLDRGSRDTLVVNGKHERSIDDVTTFISTTSPKGYLFQKVLRPDPVLGKVAGFSGLASLRFLVLFGKSGPAIERCVAKIPGEGQVADNFWRTGAQLWAVNPTTGQVERKVEQVADTLKPRLLAAQEPLTIPAFSRAVEIVSEASCLLPGIRTQSWDVALSDEGPVLLEVNFGGDLSLAQQAHGEGVLSPAYCSHLRECGYVGSLPN
ncbi:MAG: sugar-transfer associated ATP-grasp domain-containing protein [Pseudomonadota bacterium]